MNILIYVIMLVILILVILLRVLGRVMDKPTVYTYMFVAFFTGFVALFIQSKSGKGTDYDLFGLAIFLLVASIYCIIFAFRNIPKSEVDYLLPGDPISNTITRIIRRIHQLLN